MPADGESVCGLFDENRQRITTAGQSDGEVVRGGVPAFSVFPGDSPIVSIVIGSEMRTLMAGRKLFDAGVYVNSVLYPATPKDEALSDRDFCRGVEDEIVHLWVLR